MRFTQKCTLRRPLSLFSPIAFADKAGQNGGAGGIKSVVTGRKLAEASVNVTFSRIAPIMLQYRRFDTVLRTRVLRINVGNGISSSRRIFLV